MTAQLLGTVRLSPAVGLRAWNSSLMPHVLGMQQSRCEVLCRCSKVSASSTSCR